VHADCPEVGKQQVGKRSSISFLNSGESDELCDDNTIAHEGGKHNHVFATSTIGALVQRDPNEGAR
ncbi:unnamed protein product, partial [Closterium sp. NIES-53]